MKHYSYKNGDTWPKGSRIQIVKIDPDSSWGRYEDLAKKAVGLIGTLTGRFTIKCETELCNGRSVHKIGQEAYNLDEFWYIDLNDPDENY